VDVDAAVLRLQVAYRAVADLDQHLGGLLQVGPRVPVDVDQGLVGGQGEVVARVHREDLGLVLEDLEGGDRLVAGHPSRKGQARLGGPAGGTDLDIATAEPGQVADRLAYAGVVPVPGRADPDREEALVDGDRAALGGLDVEAWLQHALAGEGLAGDLQAVLLKGLRRELLGVEGTDRAAGLVRQRHADGVPRRLGRDRHIQQLDEEPLAKTHGARRRDDQVGHGGVVAGVGLGWQAVRLAGHGPDDALGRP